MVTILSFIANRYSTEPHNVCLLNYFYFENFEDCSLVIWHNIPWFGFSDVSSQLDLRCSSLAGITRCCFLITSNQVAYDFQLVPLLMITLIMQLKSARLIHCKVILFPFIINRYFVRRYFEIMWVSCFSPHFQSIHLLIDNVHTT